MSMFSEVEAVSGQGTIGGALVSQALLGDGLFVHLPSGRKLQMEFVVASLAALMCRDDKLNSAGGLNKAREVNKKFKTLMKQNSLTLNEDKYV